MVAVVIDPLVCHTWAGIFILECWGIVPCVVGALALALAWGRRSVAVRLGR